MTGTTLSRDCRILACGHYPSPHSSHTTGTVHVPGKGEICWECGNAWEVRKLADPTTSAWSGYMTAPTVTNWIGHPIALVLWRTSQRTNFGGVLVRFRCRTPDGREWFGTGTGEGMLCRFRVCKRRTR